MFSCVQVYYKEMDWKAAGLEHDPRTVGCVLYRPYAGLTGCNRYVIGMNGG